MNSNLDNIKGFYFLDWGITFKNIEEILEKKSIEYKFYSMVNEINFEYKEYKTSCHRENHNDKAGLNEVRQLQTYFSLDKAKNKFNKIFNDFKNNYGNPASTNDNGEKKQITWNGKYTTILLSLLC